MRFSSLFGSLAISVWLAATPALAQDSAFSQAQEQAIQSLVRDYLVNNPEILEEMFTALEEKRNAQAEQQMSEALGEFKSVLENDEIAQVMGNPEGAITLIEFFDYNCGVCRSEFGALQELVANNPDLKVLLWEWPVVRPPQSIDAARVSLAVREIAGQEAWESYHIKLMQHDAVVDLDAAIKLAEESALDTEEIRSRLEADFVGEHLQTAMGVGDALGFRGTPTFIIGNKVIAGGGRGAELQALIDEVRSQ